MEKLDSDLHPQSLFTPEELQSFEIDDTKKEIDGTNVAHLEEPEVNKSQAQSDNLLKNSLKTTGKSALKATFYF